MMRHTPARAVWGLCRLRSREPLRSSAGSSPLSVVEERYREELKRLQAVSCLQRVVTAMDDQRHEISLLKERFGSVERALASNGPKYQPGGPEEAPSPVWERRWEVLKNQAIQQVAELVSRVNEEQSKSAELRRRLDEVTEESRLSTLASQRRAEELNQRLVTLSNEVSVKDRLAADLVENARDLRGELLRRLEERSLADERATAATKEHQKSKESLSKALAEAAELQRERSELEKAKAQLEAELKREVEDSAEETQNLRAKLNELETQTASTVSRDLELLAETSQLTKQLVAAQTALQDREQEIVKLRQELSKSDGLLRAAAGERDDATTKLSSALTLEQELKRTISSLRSELKDRRSSDKSLSDEKDAVWAAWRHLGGTTPLLDGEETAKRPAVATLRVLTNSLKRAPSSADPEWVALGTLWYLLSATIPTHATVAVGGASYTRRSCLENALRCNPTLAAGWNELGTLLPRKGFVSIKGKEMDRQALFIRAIEADWDLTDAWVNLAEEIAAPPSTSSTRTSDDQDSSSSPTVTIMGGRYSAREILVKILHNEPATAKAWRLLGDALLQSYKGRAYDGSRIWPSDDHVANIHGKRYTVAQCYQQAILTDPTDVEAWSRLEGCVSKAGRSVSELLRKRWQWPKESRRCF